MCLGSTGYLPFADCKRTEWDSKVNKYIFLGYSENLKVYRVWDLAREPLVMTRSIRLNERPPSRYKDAIVLSEPIAQCKQFHNKSDEVKVGVTDANKNQVVDDMDVDETADNDNSWEGIVVDASRDLNPSHNLEIVPIEGDCTDLQVVVTNNKMVSRSPHETVAVSSNNGTHMLLRIPVQSRTIVLCENFCLPQMNDWRCTRGRKKAL